MPKLGRPTCRKISTDRPASSKRLLWWLWWARRMFLSAASSDARRAHSMSSSVFMQMRSRSQSRASARSRYGAMFRRASGPRSLFSGMGKSPVAMETARPSDSRNSRFSRATSKGVCVPTCDALMQTAWNPLPFASRAISSSDMAALRLSAMSSATRIETESFIGIAGETPTFPACRCGRGEWPRTASW